MNTVSAPLVGMKYHPGAAEALSELGFGDSVRLVREPSNAYDENAIQVFTGDTLLGYIAREYAADWAPSFDAFGVPDAKLTFSSSGHPRVETILQSEEDEEEEEEDLEEEDI
jgi:HIRAN domain